MTASTQTRSPASNVRVVGSAGAAATRPGLAQRLTESLLLLSALAPLYNNVAVARIGEFTVDLSHLFLISGAMLAVTVSRRVDRRVAGAWLVFIVFELIHALFFGLGAEEEWLKSVGQILVYSLAFLLFTGLRFDRDALRRMGSQAVAIAVVIGGLAILQFGLANAFGLDLNLPPRIRVTDYALLFEDWRYQGIARATLFSREPAELAFGLSALLAFLISLRAKKLIGGRMTAFSLVLVLGGIVATLAPTGLLTAVAVLLAGWLVSRSAKSSWRAYLLVVLILIVLAMLVVPLNERLNSIVRGQDLSGLIRVVAPMQLLVHLPNSAELLMFGTGLGMESRDLETYLNVYQPLVPWDLGDNFGVHNILAVIKYQQGALGLLAYLVFLWTVLRPPGKTFGKVLSNNAPIVVLLVMFVFSSGYYAAPVHWSLLAFVAVMLRAEWEETQITPADEGATARIGTRRSL